MEILSSAQIQMLLVGTLLISCLYTNYWAECEVKFFRSRSVQSSETKLGIFGNCLLEIGLIALLACMLAATFVTLGNLVFESWGWLAWLKTLIVLFGLFQIRLGFDLAHAKRYGYR